MTLEEMQKLIGQKQVASATIVKAGDLGEGEIEAIVATDSLDRHGEVLMISGVKTENYMKNPVVLFGHRMDQPPVAKTLSLKKVTNDKGVEQIVARFKFAIAEYAFAKTIYDLIKGGFLSAFSIGFIPKDAKEINGKFTWTDSEMIEFSVVPVPANPEALALAKSFDILERVNKGELQITDIKADEDTETKEGKVLSKKNRAIVEAARDALNTLLEATTDTSEDKSGDGVEGDIINSMKDTISATEKLLSQDTDATSGRKVRKIKLVQAKKLTQNIDKQAEALISALNGRINREV